MAQHAGCDMESSYVWTFEILKKIGVSSKETRRRRVYSEDSVDMWPNV